MIYKRPNKQQRIDLCVSCQLDVCDRYSQKCGIRKANNLHKKHWARAHPYNKDKRKEYLSRPETKELNKIAAKKRRDADPALMKEYRTRFFSDPETRERYRIYSQTRRDQKKERELLCSI